MVGPSPSLHYLHRTVASRLTVQAYHSEENKEHSPIMRPDKTEDVGEERLPKEVVEEEIASLH